MANETPNRVHASGTFVGTAAIGPPFTARTITSKDVLAFARLGVGLYRLTFQRALAFGEGYADVALPAAMVDAVNSLTLIQRP